MLRLISWGAANDDPEILPYMSRPQATKAMKVRCTSPWDVLGHESIVTYRADLLYGQKRRENVSGVQIISL